MAEETCTTCASSSSVLRRELAEIGGVLAAAGGIHAFASAVGHYQYGGALLLGMGVLVLAAAVACRLVGHRRRGGLARSSTPPGRPPSASSSDRDGWQGPGSERQPRSRVTAPIGIPAATRPLVGPSSTRAGMGWKHPLGVDQGLPPTVTGWPGAQPSQRTGGAHASRVAS